MKQLAFVIFAAALAAFVLLGNSADASPEARITLTAGKSAVVLANGCTLQVTNNSMTLVRIKCKASAGAENSSVPQATTAKVTLSAGQRVAIAANQCALGIVVQKPARVKVTCLALPTPTPTEPPDASVTVGPGGMLTFSPGTVNIQVGETVEWNWASNNHTVTSGDGTMPDNLFCSPNNTNCATAPASNTGFKYRHTFNSTGSFDYYCRIHGATMSGVVNVNP